MTSDRLASVRRYIRENQDRFIEDLKTVCRLESVSARGESLRPTARAFAALLARAGVEARLEETPGQPILVGRVDSGRAAAGDEAAGGPTSGPAAAQRPAVPGSSRRPAVLFYNHYDVQPPEPLEEWTSPPFEPTLRDGRLFARGVSDDKGNLLARIHAVEAWNKAGGGLPASVSFVAEGEEEIGSPHLEDFVRANAGWLREVDGVVWESGNRDSAGRPTMTLGVKGICYLELRATGATTDLHSSLAVLVPNPAWRLVWALSTIKDESERILVDGFYDDVRAPSPEELEALRSIPDNTARQAEEYGLPGLLLGLTGLGALRRSFYEPTATICGLLSGYTGPGEKTVLPSRAMAKVDFRLVPDQDPADIEAKVRDHLRRRGFGDIEVKAFAGERAARTDPRHPFVAAARRAIGLVYGQETVVHPTMTGSGPMPFFATDLGLPVVGFGVGNSRSSVHAPNENVVVEDYILGVETVAALLEEVAGSAR